LVFTAAVPAILFPLFYAGGSPWRTTLVGKMMMNKASAIGITFALIVLGVIAGPDYPGRDAIRLVAYAYLAVSLWGELLLLLRIQSCARRGDQNCVDTRTTPDKERST
jgi:hypothetical protein